MINDQSQFLLHGLVQVLYSGFVCEDVMFYEVHFFGPITKLLGHIVLSLSIFSLSVILQQTVFRLFLWDDLKWKLILVLL